MCVMCAYARGKSLLGNLVHLSWKSYCFVRNPLEIRRNPKSKFRFYLAKRSYKLFYPSYFYSSDVILFAYIKCCSNYI